MNINDDIIQALWNGRICPNEEIGDNAQYQAALKHLDFCEETMKNFIEAENRRFLDDLLSAYADLETIVEYRAFRYGFKLAVKLLGNVM